MNARAPAKPTAMTRDALVRFPSQLSPAVPVRARCQEHSRWESGIRDAHFDLEFGMVLEGRMRRLWRGVSRDLGPGQVWCCGIWEPHGAELLKCSCRNIILMIQPQLLARTCFEEAPHINWLAPFLGDPAHRPQIPRRRLAEALGLGARIAAVAESPKPPEQIRLRLLLLEILSLLAETGAPEPSRPTMGEDHYALVGRGIEMVLATDRVLRLTDVAHKLGVSAKTYGKHFRRIIGTDYSEFMLTQRLGPAAMRLAGTRDLVKRIALEAGFRQVSHFDRCFRRHFGCSPGEYRARAQ